MTLWALKKSIILYRFQKVRRSLVTKSTYTELFLLKKAKFVHPDLDFRKGDFYIMSNSKRRRIFRSKKVKKAPEKGYNRS